MDLLNKAFEDQQNLDMDELHADSLDESIFVLAFDVEGSSFSISFEDVHEIVDIHPYTEYPTDHKGHLGVINLRGSLVPIVSPFSDRSAHDIDFSDGTQKYIIFDTPTDQLIGIVASNIRKIEVTDEDLKFDQTHHAAEKFLAKEDQAIRYIELDYILSRYGGKDDERS